MLQKRSRTITGLHRLGVVLAVPLVVVGIGVGISAWFSNNGPIVPNPTIQAPLPVQTAENYPNATSQPDVNAARQLAIQRARIRAKTAERFAKLEIDTGTHRVFALYNAAPDGQIEQRLKALVEADAAGNTDLATTLANSLRPILDVRREGNAAVITSLMSFEKNRGAVISAAEQPVLVGDVLLQETEDASFTYLGWTHLKRGFDWGPIFWACLWAALGIAVYVVARALGWVIDGFVTKTNSAG